MYFEFHTNFQQKTGRIAVTNITCKYIYSYLFHFVIALFLTAVEYNE